MHLIEAGCLAAHALAKLTLVTYYRPTSNQKEMNRYGNSA